jgi:hypothetical protein
MKKAPLLHRIFGKKGTPTKEDVAYAERAVSRSQIDKIKEQLRALGNEMRQMSENSEVLDHVQASKK